MNLIYIFLLIFCLIIVLKIFYHLLILFQSWNCLRPRYGIVIEKKSENKNLICVVKRFGKLYDIKVNSIEYEKIQTGDKYDLSYDLGLGSWPP